MAYKGKSISLMIFSLSLALFFLIVIPWLIVINRKKHLNHLILMKHGMIYITHVRKMLEHIPLHRGMANAFLNGDHSFQERLSNMQTNIANDITAIDERLTHQPLPSSLTVRWKKIESNWHKLKSDINSISANESFERHTELITEILRLISDSADDMRISAHPDNELRRIAKATFNQLPTMIEVIGQSRGIGAGAAAKGNVATAVHIKLKFLHDRLTSTTITTQKTIESCLQNSQSQFQIDQQTIHNCFANTNIFLNTISENMLTLGPTNISAEKYFATGNKAFDSNIQLFDMISTALEKDLQQRIPHQRNKLKLSVGGAIIILTSSFFLWQQVVIR